MSIAYQIPVKAVSSLLLILFSFTILPPLYLLMKNQLNQSIFVIGLILSLTVLFLLGYSLVYNRLWLAADGLNAQSGLYQTYLPLKAIRRVQYFSPEELRVSEYNPMWRQNGLVWMGIQTGWYELQNGRRAFLLRMDQQQELTLIEGDEFDLLLSGHHLIHANSLTDPKMPLFD